MTLKLKRIAPLQAGKMLAAFYGLISLIIIPFMLAFVGVASVAAKSAGGGGAAPFAMFMGMGVGMIIVIPIFYAVMGFVGGVICAFIYNLLAGWMGGFEMEFEQAVPPVAAGGAA